MKLCNLIFFALIGVCVGGMIYGNVSTMERNEQIHHIK
jgi:hypothetical protein